MVRPSCLVVVASSGSSGSSGSISSCIIIIKIIIILLFLLLLIIITIICSSSRASQRWRRSCLLLRTIRRHELTNHAELSRAHSPSATCTLHEYACTANTSTSTSTSTSASTTAGTFNSNLRRWEQVSPPELEAVVRPALAGEGIEARRGTRELPRDVVARRRALACHASVHELEVGAVDAARRQANRVVVQVQSLPSAGARARRRGDGSGAEGEGLGGEGRRREGGEVGAVRRVQVSRWR